MVHEHLEDRLAAVPTVGLPLAMAARAANPVRPAGGPNEIVPKAPERPARPVLKRRAVDSGEVFRFWAFR
jgi:hypothetical protein